MSETTAPLPNATPGAPADALGPNGEKALAAERDARKAAERNAAALQTALSKAESERDAAVERANVAEAWKADREAADKLDKVRQEVAEATGVPATALRGANRAELQAHADALKPLLTPPPRGPVVPDPGKTPDKPANAGDADERAAVAALFGRGG
jgi:hypothetical protein